MVIYYYEIIRNLEVKIIGKQRLQTTTQPFIHKMKYVFKNSSAIVTFFYKKSITRS